MEARITKTIDVKSINNFLENPTVNYSETKTIKIAQKSNVVVAEWNSIEGWTCEDKAHEKILMIHELNQKMGYMEITEYPCLFYLIKAIVLGQKEDFAYSTNTFFDLLKRNFSPQHKIWSFINKNIFDL